MFKVAIVGKPNVGKSTLFNKLCGKRIAIVDDMPGVTRDRKEFNARLGDLEFKLCDTAGWERTKSSLQQEMAKQGKLAIDDADLILFMLDAKNGITYEDLDFAKELRRCDKPILVLANKSEGEKSANESDIYALGIGEPVYISAAHKLGFEDLYQWISQNKPQNSTVEDEQQADIKICLAGRPNVGKSTLFNKLLGFERTVVSDVAGTTRDTITHYLDYQDKQIELIDTAGLRKRAKIKERVEDFSSGESITAIRRANVVVLVVDASQPLEKQDLSIASIAINEGKAVVLVINKCDLIKDKKYLREEIEYLIANNLFDLHGLPMIFTTAIHGRGIDSIMSEVISTHARWNRKLSTGELNKWLKEAIENHIPPLAQNGRRIRLKYITQTKQKPPTFTVFANIPEDLPDSYRRYLVNDMRNSLQLDGLPLRVNFKKNENPYG
jgi:GTP-binding protein